MMNKHGQWPTLEVIDERLRYMAHEQDRQGKDLAHIKSKVDMLNDWHHQVNGVLALGKWGIPVLVGLGSLATTLLIKFLS